MKFKNKYKAFVDVHSRGQTFTSTCHEHERRGILGLLNVSLESLFFRME